MEKRMELAKESKTVVRLRRKLKKRLRAESKVIKKRDLKKISELIRLRFNKQSLDLQKTTLQQASTTIQKVRATVIQNSDNLLDLRQKALKPEFCIPLE
jgi:hypothetical protein